MRIYQMANNQFEIRTKQGIFFQSYDSIIALKKNNGKIVLGQDWRYSRTTMKYLIQFLNRDSIREVDKMVASGEIKINEDLMIKG